MRSKKQKLLETRYQMTWFPHVTPWALQVTMGRSGSNGLFNYVNSFLDGHTIRIPDGEELKQYDFYCPIKERLAMHKSYLYLISTFYPDDWDIPLYIHFLKNSPKVVHLRRLDLLARAVSYFYASRKWKEEHKFEKGKRGRLQKEEVEAIFRTPLIISELDTCLQELYTATVYTQRVITHFVEPSRYLPVTHYGIFYGAYRERKRLMQFLECEPPAEDALRFRKETPIENIPNRAEIEKYYGRALDELPEWYPPWISLQDLERVAHERFLELWEQNMPPKEILPKILPRAKPRWQR